MSELITVDPTPVEIGEHSALAAAITVASNRAHELGIFVLQPDFSEELKTEIVGYTEDVVASRLLVTNGTSRPGILSEPVVIEEEYSRTARHFIKARNHYPQVDKALRQGIAGSIVHIRKRGAVALKPSVAVNKMPAGDAGNLHRDLNHDTAVVICPDPFRLLAYRSKRLGLTYDRSSEEELTANCAIIGIRGPRHFFFGRHGIWHQFFNPNDSAPRHSLVVGSEHTSAFLA